LSLVSYKQTPTTKKDEVKEPGKDKNGGGHKTINISHSIDDTHGSETSNGRGIKDFDKNLFFGIFFRVFVSIEYRKDDKMGAGNIWPEVKIRAKGSGV